MDWFNRDRTIELTSLLEKRGASKCPVCGDNPMLAFAPTHKGSFRMVMVNPLTGEEHQTMFFDLVMCSRCGYTRLHHESALSDWLESGEESGHNERT